MSKKREDRWKPNPQLTRKENNFVRHIVENPRLSATSAVQSTYNAKTYNTAKHMASEIMAKPHIQAELAKYDGEAQVTVYEVMKYSKEYGREGGKEGASYAGVALSAANSLLDRIHGKATQRTENLNVAVELNVNLAE